MIIAPLFIKLLLSLLHCKNIEMSIDSNFQNQLEIHTNLCEFVARDQYGKNKKQLIAEDCWIIINRLKSLIYQYLEGHSYTDLNMQLLYEFVNEHFFNLTHYYTVIKNDMLNQIPNFFEIIILPIISFFVKEFTLLSTASIIQNTYDKKSQILSECLCEQQVNGIENLIANNSFCYRCGQIFHETCFQIKPTQLYECFFCFLKYCRPDRQVIATLFKGYLAPAQSNNNISIIQNQWPLMDFCNQGASIQLRCARISQNNAYQITWPEKCEIFLDQFKSSVSFTPLPEHSPLKRRHDNPIIVSFKDLASSQKIKIIEEPSHVSSWHLLTIFVVKQRNQYQIFNSILNNPFNRISKSESDEYLQKLFWKSTGVQTEKINISNQCQFYGEKITYPCRSRHCTTHYQPFDLYSFILSSVQAKSSVKQWKCPLCNVRAYDVVLDLRISHNLNQSANTKKHEFYFQLSQKLQDQKKPLKKASLNSIKQSHDHLY